MVFPMSVNVHLLGNLTNELMPDMSDGLVEEQFFFNRAVQFINQGGDLGSRCCGNAIARQSCLIRLVAVGFHRVMSLSKLFKIVGVRHTEIDDKRLMSWHSSMSSNDTIA